MASKSYILELPVMEPSSQFKGFIEGLKSSIDESCEFQYIQYDCKIQYWKNELIFSSNNMPRKNGKVGRTVSIKPIGDPATISKIVSKFNAAVGITLRDCKISIELIKTNSEIPDCLKITMTVETLAAQMALSNYFSFVDACTH